MKEKPPTREAVLQAAIEAQSRRLERDGNYHSAMSRVADQHRVTIDEVRASYEDR